MVVPLSPGGFADIPTRLLAPRLAFAAPPGTPQDIVQRLYAETAKVLQNQELQLSFRAAGVEAQVLGPQDLAAFMRAEYDKWGKVVRATGATVN